MKELNKKTITLILIITFVFSPIFAIPAQAQWVDISTAAKDYGLDGLAWMVVNRVINRMTASTVKWINSGFKGSPAYITDPASYYKNLGDKIAGQYIYNNPNLNFLCGDMSVKVKLALSRSYNYNNEPLNWRCSLTEVVDNLDNFMNDFEQGGWDGFFELTQRQQNNPIGIYLQASDAMYDAIESRTDLTREELSQGKGFFSQKKCIKWGPGVEVVDYQTGQTVPGEPVCLKEETTTPGDVISSQLNKQLGLGNDRLSISDEINELVSSLLNQLIGQVMGGIGGLRGASESDSSNDNKILTEQLAIPTAEEEVDYFNRPQNTSVLDVPLPGSTATLILYTTEQLAQSADTLTYNSAVTADQMLAIRDLWVSKIEAGSVLVISPNSVLAYMLGWGGAIEGTFQTVSGITYKFTSGIWVKQ